MIQPRVRRIAGAMCRTEDLPPEVLAELEVIEMACRRTGHTRLSTETIALVCHRAGMLGPETREIAAAKNPPARKKKNSGKAKGNGRLTTIVDFERATMPDDWSKVVKDFPVIVDHYGYKQGKFVGVRARKKLAVKINGKVREIRQKRVRILDG